MQLGAGGLSVDSLLGGGAAKGNHKKRN
jgi:hypothetical protein